MNNPIHLKDFTVSSRDYWRKLEIIRDYWRLLEITGQNSDWTKLHDTL